MTDRESQPEPAEHAAAARPLGDELKLPATAQLAVLGQPISHSRSPQIHAAAYRVLGLDWRYDAIECGVAGLEALLAARHEAKPGLADAADSDGLTPDATDSGAPDPDAPPWRGFSLTMPLKEEAHRIAAVLDPVAEASGVVNTLLPIIGGRWAGFNTDVGGLAAAMTSAGLDASRTVIIGSGATAVSAILAARRIGAQEIMLYARNSAAVGELVTRFDGTRETEAGPALAVSGVGWSVFEAPSDAPFDAPFDASLISVEHRPTLVISTLPGPVGAGLALPAALLETPLFDVAYDPWPSPLAERWREAGGIAYAGTEMLVEQALAQVRIFVGGDPAIPLNDEASVLAAMRLAASRSVKE